MPLPRRFAAIADIHGNSDALSAVLARIDAMEIELVVNLGDMFSGPLAAGETWEILRARPMPTVRGNHDRYLISQTPEEMGASDRAAHDDLPPEALDWLRELPVTLEMDEAFLCHATPGADDRYWLHDVDAGGMVHPAGAEQIARHLEGVPQPLVLCAHTHLPRVVSWQRHCVVNPGSVGCPGYTDIHPVPHVVETGTPHACFAVLETEGAAWHVAHHHVPYDPSRMAQRARSQGRAGWAEALTTGWISREAANPIGQTAGG
ncbi:metallophosphoesterase family protein [Alloyangia pacifica]|uniref:metallophosphoesterase family protein n=1 Tax=Alloyangia pacifica TaxID=311180 RepID=UPI001CD25BEB|nr:metallophosphoesterase family protein [Alloyangia pacifica]MCA0997622.1 metallophosphatase family protein [Alloyangia pacifica]